MENLLENFLENFIKFVIKNFKVDANMTGLHNLQSKLPNDLEAFGFSQDFEPDMDYQPVIVEDTTGQLVQFPVVKHKDGATNFARCHGLWNLFPVDPFKIAKYDIGQSF